MVQSPFRDHRLDIADLVHRYAFYVRNRQAALCADLFSDDAVFEIREVDPLEASGVTVRQVLNGRRAIGDYVTKTEASSLRICPLIFNLLVEVKGSTAVSNAMMQSRTWPAGHEVIGQYDDSFVQHQAEWVFQSRIFTIFTLPAQPSLG